MNQTNLLRNATPAQLERAAALNHTELFGLDARALGGEMRQKDGLSWTRVGTNAESMIPFPELPPGTAGEQLDGLIAEYLLHPPKGAGCWSLDPPKPADLGLRLLARGFQPGWRPCWMALDLEKMAPAYPSPKELRILPDNLATLLEVKGLPYARAIIPPRPSLPPEQEQGAGVQRFIAWLGKRVAGHCGVLLTTGDHGVAGIYHVGVIPGARNNGIGKALVMAACLYAKGRGYRYAVLNATGRRMYEQIGFTWIGDGWTWWLKTGRLLANPPNKAQVALAEAIGRGDLQALDHPDQPFSADDLHRPMTNGMTLVQLAVHCQQPASGEWLLARGCSFQVLDAWDLGWKDRAALQLRKFPEQANQLYGEWEKTLLHVAAERNDIELASLALSAHPNLKIKDKAYQSTARDWARHFGHEEILRLIRK
jgi:GNAT superfamily N-acetyltransferase